MHHWKGTDPGDPSAPQLTMYWGRLGSRPWYRISAGTCSTSSSPWRQERTENLIPGAATSTMEREPKGRTPPTLAPTPSAPENPLPSKPNPSALPKKPGSTKCPQLPARDLHPIPIPHSPRRGGSAGTPLPCAPAPQQWTCTCAAGGQGRVTTAPQCCPQPQPAPTILSHPSCIPVPGVTCVDVQGGNCWAQV